MPIAYRDRNWKTSIALGGSVGDITFKNPPGFPPPEQGVTEQRWRAKRPKTPKMPRERELRPVSAREFARAQAQPEVLDPNRPNWAENLFLGGRKWGERGAAESLIGGWVAPALIPGGLVRTPISLGAKILPKAVTSSKVAGGVGKVLDVTVGKKAPTKIPTETDIIISEMTALINKAKPVTRETQMLVHKETQRRAAAVSGVLKGKYPTEKVFQVAKGAMKGEMPKAVFEPPKEQMSPWKIVRLQDMIRNFEPWSRKPFTKIATNDSLMKVWNGEIVSRSETANLERVFGIEFVKALLKKRSMGMRVFENTMDAIGLPKALVSSVDISAPGRQGVMLIGEKGWWTSWKPMMKALLSDKNSVVINQSIENNPLYRYVESTKLYLAPYKSISARLEKYEESFMSRWAEKIPWVRASNQAYITFLNKLRADTFYSYARNWAETMPEEELIPKLTKLADFINKATGRGRLGMLERSGETQQVLNAAFFSPRFVASRIQVPFSVFQKDGKVRDIIAKNMVAYMSANLGILGLAYAGGASIGLDPRSPDFGKVKIGNTRLDFWGGEQPLARYFVQFLTATRKLTTGETQRIERSEVAGRFIQSKLAPTAGLILAALQERNFIGDPMELNSETAIREFRNQVVPMFIEDLIDAIMEEGLIGIPMALPSLIGASVTTYREKGSATSTTGRWRARR